MTTQLNIFSDKVCVHCNTNPGSKPGKPVLWNGFLDRDTGEYVCRKCRPKHYKLKYNTEFRYHYSETPVIAIS